MVDLKYTFFQGSLLDQIAIVCGNNIPIHLKITLSIKEANKLTGIGINSIEDRLREPNCPFVLFVGAKNMIKRKEFEEYISKTLIF